MLKTLVMFQSNSQTFRMELFLASSLGMMTQWLTCCSYFLTDSCSLGKVVTSARHSVYRCGSCHQQLYGLQWQPEQKRFVILVLIVHKGLKKIVLESMTQDHIASCFPLLGGIISQQDTLLMQKEENLLLIYVLVIKVMIPVAPKCCFCQEHQSFTIDTLYIAPAGFSKNIGVMTVWSQGVM